MHPSTFALLALAGAAVATPVIEKRDVSTVKSDIKKIGTQLKALEASLSAKGDLTYSSAIAVAGKSGDLKKAIDAATKDTQALKSVSEADGKAVIALVKGLQPNINSALAAFIKRKANFAKLGLTSIAKSQVQGLATSTDSFADALIAKAPASLKAQGTSIKKDIDAQFAKALKAYA